jgi:ATP-dependent Clp protease ATP-binding subunit ClpA
VEIGSGLLPLVVSLCERHLPERNFPDKAFDILDIACAEASALREEHLAERHLRSVVEQRSGVVFTADSPKFRRRLDNMEEFLAERVVGHREEISDLASVVRMCKRQLDLHPERPDGVFLLCGPTGVGKTLVARSLAEAITGNPNALIRIDMNGFTERHSVSGLLGTPPGYVGYGDESALVKGLRAHPSGVLLLDEFEKAHTAVLQIFLQAFDEGRIVDFKGVAHSLSNITVVATSNAPVDPDAPGSLRSQLAKTFPPELLGRFDEIIALRPLGREEVLEILRNHILKPADRRFRETSGTSIRLSPAAENALLEIARYSEFGAREIQHAFRKFIHSPAARWIDDPEIRAARSIWIDWDANNE